MPLAHGPQPVHRPARQFGQPPSWYREADGRNSTLWPRSTIAFRHRLARFDPESYRVQSARSLADTST